MCLNVVLLMCVCFIVCRDSVPLYLCHQSPLAKAALSLDTVYCASGSFVTSKAVLMQSTQQQLEGLEREETAAGKAAQLKALEISDMKQR